MKPNRIMLVLLLNVLLSIAFASDYCIWTGDPMGRFWNRWSVGLTGGFTSYYGDLSIYDSDILGKYQYESRPAIGFLLTKNIHDDIGLSGQFIYGGLKGSDGTEASFKTRIYEYNAQVRVDVLNLLLKKNPTGIGLMVSAGIGHVFFSVEKYFPMESGKQTVSHRSKTPEFVYFGGIGVSVRTTERMKVFVEYGIRQLQNDRLDETVLNNNFDHYTVLSIGITYAIGREYARAKEINLNQTRKRLVYR